jgi:hypothetical protein
MAIVMRATYLCVQQSEVDTPITVQTPTAKENNGLTELVNGFLRTRVDALIKQQQQKRRAFYHAKLRAEERQ